jgi:hypothetical protein
MGLFASTLREPIQTENENMETLEELTSPMTIVEKRVRFDDGLIMGPEELAESMHKLAIDSAENINNALKGIPERPLTELRTQIVDDIESIAAKLDPFIKWTPRKLFSLDENRQSTTTLSPNNHSDVFVPPKRSRSLNNFTKPLFLTRPAFRNEDRYPDARIVTEAWVLNSDLQEFASVLRNNECVRLGKNQTVLQVLCREINSVSAKERLVLALECGQNPNELDDLLMFCSKELVMSCHRNPSRFIEIMEVLLEHGLNINMTEYTHVNMDHYGRNILKIAFVVTADLRIIEYLLEKGTESYNVYQMNTFNRGEYRERVIELISSYKK